MRTMSSANLAALARGEIVPRALVKLDMLEQTFGFWNDLGSISVSGVTYVGTGALGAISALPSTTAMSVPNFTLTLSGLSDDVLAEFFNYTWHQRPVSVYLALLDPNTRALVDTPTLVASGRMDKASIKGGADAQSTLEIMCEDVSRRLTWSNPSVRSHGDQLLRANNDTFFQYVATAPQQQMYWGQKQPIPAHAVISNGGKPVSVA